MKMKLALAAMAFAATMAAGYIHRIGDNDGYGIGIADGANHPFNGFTANYDGRDAAEMAATDGAQYTDTYSTTHPGYGPQPGTVATFIWSSVPNLTAAYLLIDMADFQASTFGAVAVTFNGIAQNWAFNDGFPSTRIRDFQLSQAVVDSINLLGSLTVVIDRNNSSDFYGFDFAELREGTVPEPATWAMIGAGMAAIGMLRRRR
jgi:hypothetical protein